MRLIFCLGTVCPPAVSADLRVTLSGAELSQPLPWFSLRRAVSELAASIGRAALARTMRPYRIPLSLVFPELLGDLTAEERQQRRELSGLQLGLVPNYAVGCLPVAAAWADWWADLFAERRVCMELPQPARVDSDSLMALRMLAASAVRSGGLRIIGAAPEFPAVEGLARYEVSARKTELAWLCALVEPEGARLERAAARRPAALQDDAPDAGFWQDPPVQPADADAVTAVEYALEARALYAALQMARALLERAPDLPSAARARLHLVAAVAGHNVALYEMRRKQDHASIRGHLERVLADSGDARDLALAEQMLAVLVSRGLGDFEAGLVRGQRAIQRAEGLGDEYIEAWCRNGYAYSLHRLGRAAEATSEVERALGLVEALADEVPAELRGRTLLHLLTNLVRADPRPERSRHWRQRLRDLAIELPELTRAYPDLLFLFTDHAALEHTIEMLGACVASAQRRGCLYAEARALDLLADLRFRLGQAREAAVIYGRAIELWQRLGRAGIEDAAEGVLNDRLNRAVASYRAGACQEAAEQFCGLRQLFGEADPELNADLSSAQAVVAASLGLVPKVEAFMAEALHFLAACEDPGVVLRARRWLAEAQRLLGDDEHARELLIPALAALRARPEAFAPEDCFGAIACALRLSLGQDLRALGLTVLERALADANAWWELETYARQPGVSDDQRRALDCALRQRVESCASASA